MTGFSRLLTIGAIFLAPLLTGCAEEAPPEPLPVRAIKYMTVSERAADQIRRLAGVVQAGTTTDIAFEIGGQVTALPVGIGDSVKQGEHVGRLDAERYTLSLESAKGELQNAEAKLRDAQKKFAQQKELHDKGFATKTAYDSALASLESARSQVEIARSQVAISRRDVQKTVLVAPFDGRVSAKYVEVFTEVAAGQQILQIHSEGDFEVVASVPETLIQVVGVGAPVDIRFTTLGGALEAASRIAKGTVTEVGSQATAANAYQVIARIDDQVPGVRPGMTAEVAFRFETEASGKAFMLPKAAVRVGKEVRQGLVYAFDAEAKVVREREVYVVNIRDNDLEVTGDIAAGDILAVAGVSFLADGMPVRLLDGLPGS